MAGTPYYSRFKPPERCLSITFPYSRFHSPYYYYYYKGFPPYIIIRTPRIGLGIGSVLPLLIDNRICLPGGYLDWPSRRRSSLQPTSKRPLSNRSMERVGYLIRIYPHLKKEGLLLRNWECLLSRRKDWELLDRYDQVKGEERMLWMAYYQVSNLFSIS